MIVGPSVKGVHGAALQSAIYFLDLCGVFQDVYRIDPGAEVKTIIQKVLCWFSVKGRTRVPR